MSALAAQLSQQLTMSPLTSYECAQGMSFRFMFDDVVDSSPDNASGAMVGVVMRGLCVDASVPMAKLLKFRQSREDQYLDFAGKISELSKSLQRPERLKVKSYLKRFHLFMRCIQRHGRSSGIRLA